VKTIIKNGRGGGGGNFCFIKNLRIRIRQPGGGGTGDSRSDQILFVVKDLVERSTCDVKV